MTQASRISLREQQVIARWLNSGIADALAQYVKRLGTRNGTGKRRSTWASWLTSCAIRWRRHAWPLQRLRNRELTVGGLGRSTSWNEASAAPRT